MKRIAFVLFVALIAAGCRKDKIIKKTTPATSTALFAKWELWYQDGGLQPGIYFAPGSGNIVQFNADSTYVFYQKAVVIKQGTFHIQENAYSLGAGKVAYIYFDHSTTSEPLQLKKDTLIIGTNIADGLLSIYLKK
ncbi:hypothetical protein KXD93_26640 [Mucilaginibacter sp. BJC16-A38]|uniref:hypothetical protein n=1 Tax=Mucilaginibacter phenanthrenivorans TaxID=1234842 RepID=UPI00215777BF|nr:hypothetical protein [Mucilaginibacter phenanthrenivorans]MCR8561259.1 hypothetical protein [Mucilaginibacter phenanthrenivorans]